MDYAVKVYAENSYGRSLESTSIEVYCGAEPDKPNTPSTSVNADEVDLTWTAPFYGGYSIEYYTVYIKK